MELGKTMDYSGFLDTISNIQQPQSGGGGEDKIKTYKLWGTLSRKLKKKTQNGRKAVCKYFLIENLYP